MRNIFARIWALWGIISFISTFLLIFIPSMIAYLIKDPLKSQRYFIYVSRIWMNVWLRLIACPVKISGRENFAPGENYVVVFNHNALLDVPLSAPYVPGANKTIAKKSFAKVPLFGLFYTKGSVLVDRKSEQSRVKSYEAMKQVLRMGMHMCIYPEGTRNRTDQPLKQFYDGAFKLSVDAQKKVLPCVIKGTSKAMPIHQSFYLLPTRLSMDFLPPVSPEGLDAKALKEKVYHVMLNEYTK
ncbi:1-acyl-sn-glycerol-3-phosphate acyltransferase [Ferruginibacter sp. HRS2-29]|uniref:lysophospholipid acyltransferase family protein n=1 Tax=Ferruginibacter sp. HRS2-29 TaxID=2487334 RepID=UPI0020CC0E7D|nr:lysophospholipid acyltransferase family protein [Ferruginibacter sp. HRS2-29]MCP9752459.1 1-acyl-sn-glycerol-3-phosphate acyltransferase [Ferruginibacter sp. HRS2-29]